MRYQIKQPELHDLLREIRSLIDSYGSDKFLVGELPDVEYLGNGTDELHMVFNFPLMYEGITKEDVLKNQRERLPVHPDGSWQGNTLSNHDQSRIRSKYSDDNLNSLALKQAVFLMMTLKGTPFLYYGEELGMRNYSPEKIEDFKDLKSVNLYHMKRESGLSHDEALEIAKIDTRDRCRTPMPWNSSKNGGFSTTGDKTWLPLDPEYKSGINVEDQSINSKSLLNFYKRIINFRNTHKTLQLGEYIECDCNDDRILMFKRVFENEHYEIVINYSHDDVKITPADMGNKELVFGEADQYIDNIIKTGATIILKVIV